MSWDRVIGQSEAVRRLQAAVDTPVHAYLFVGPAGAGKRQAALVFAGELLAAADPEGAERHRRLAVSEGHADVHILDPTGNNLRRDEEAEPLIIQASRSPVEGKRKVLVVNRFHTATPAAAASLLKTIEEPPETTLFVLLAEEVAPEHVTIESRCARVDFPPVAADAIAESLVSDGLVDSERAAVVAAAAGGSVQRARDLTKDERLATRRDAWWGAPSRLDGTGAAVAVVVEELRALIDEASESAGTGERHRAELASLDEREEQLGMRGSGRRDLEARQRRELRQLRTDELRFGLSTLAGRYREAIIGGDERAGVLGAASHIRATHESLKRNPNEALALQALLLKLPALQG
jgi:DNA polymerase-3 subunit delta'